MFRLQFGIVCAMWLGILGFGAAATQGKLWNPQSFRNSSPREKMGERAVSDPDTRGGESFMMTGSQESGQLSLETEEGLRELAKIDDRVWTILDDPQKYPEELLDALSHNGEMLEFVLDYPVKRDDPAADTVGEVKKGRVPLLLQWDSRWGYTEYGGSILACTGCGPTCLSMVICGLTGENKATPWQIAEYAERNGFYEAGAGTRWALMSEGSAVYGVQGKEISLSRDTVFRALEQGHPLICSMRPGDFTTTGHFIVLTGVEEGEIRLHDPNSRERSSQLWDYETLESQIRNLWEFTLM